MTIRWCVSPGSLAGSTWTVTLAACSSSAASVCSALGGWAGSSISPKDVIEPRSVIKGVLSDAMANNAPLWKLTRKSVTEELLKEVAVEYAKGRFVMIGTADIDTRRAILWDMGKIATYGGPKALDLFVSVMGGMASPASPLGEALRPNPPDFSLVLGGPLFQLLRRAHMTGDALELMRRRVVLFSLFAWVPLLVLSALEGRAWIELSLIPTHPDRVGGLGFLATTVYALVPLALAHGALLAALIANRIFYLGARLLDFKIEVAVVVAFMLCLVFGPLMVFAAQLAQAKRTGSREYGTLAERYVREFDAKWLRSGAPADERLF